MSASQDYGLRPPGSFDDSGQKLDLTYIAGLIRRRILYFALPFLFILVVAFAAAEMQQPLYRASGEILVESPAVPSDFVHPTITELPDERFELIKQRILASENLMTVIDKYNLFSSARGSMPEYVVLALMRTRVTLKPVPLELTQPGTSTTAFTIGFDYEQPDLALQVTDEFIREILSQDSSRRTNDASEITKFLDQDVRRLQQEHDAVIAQIEAIKQSPPNKTEAISEETKVNMKSLADLEAELVQKSAVYSDEYPIVKELKKKIAALKRIIASTPQAPVATDSGNNGQTGATIEVLKEQAINLQNNLDDANRKLAAARLGESMEKNREAEHLQLIAQPELPHRPVESKKLKFFAAGFAIAGLIGAGSLYAAEALNGGIRRRQELFGIVDRKLIVSIPYLSLPGEQRRRRRNLVVTLTIAVSLTILAMAIIYALAKGLTLEDTRMWIDTLMHGN